MKPLPDKRCGRSALRIPQSLISDVRGRGAEAPSPTQAEAEQARKALIGSGLGEVEPMGRRRIRDTCENRLSFSVLNIVAEVKSAIVNRGSSSASIANGLRIEILEPLSALKMPATANEWLKLLERHG